MKQINNIKEIDFPYIKEYVTEKGKADIEWLIELFDKKVPPDKNGKERSISFIEVRKEFVLKYMPELMPEPKKKNPTMYDEIKALKASLK